MDIVSHGLWGALAFGRQKRRDFWIAFFFGVSPDLFSFGIYFIQRLLSGISPFGGGRPDPSVIPSYVPVFYNITHSLVVFALIFGVVWLLRKKPFWLMGAWGLHILFDMPVHELTFYPTPYLWPFHTPFIDGVPWSHPAIFFPNVIFLVVLYLYFFLLRPYLAKRRAVA